MAFNWRTVRGDITLILCLALVVAAVGILVAAAAIDIKYLDAIGRPF